MAASSRGKGNGAPLSVSANDKLRTTQQLLVEEYQNMSSATHSVANTSRNIHGAKDKYEQYCEKIRRSQQLVADIQKAERWDEQKLRYAFNFFLFTATYLLLKRFFLWEIIYAAYFFLYIFTTYLTEFVLMPLFAL